jgi:hypothetical protein
MTKDSDAGAVEILSFLRAYPFHLVQTALKKWRVADAKQRADEYWQPFVGDPDEVPANHDWRVIGSKMQIRRSDRRPKPLPSEPAAKSPAPTTGVNKLDLSAKMVERLRCPECGGVMFKEGICPGCADGRKGYRIRLLCGECDYTEKL